ncbi:hypothetical protein LAZ67_10003203 [Cordylochernes scorpioides]|uniref:Uncharacterized protein n=1 Tax=Cordylochernes scorpioides TaxID=51811 RepID=A0ABY6KXU4_9ARAC|nr:hypothetical protein LAZ67_10003203 [Cordylochernes scorpioides]
MKPYHDPEDQADLFKTWICSNRHGQIKQVHDPTCPHCQEEDQNVEHVNCPAFQLQRFQTATFLELTSFKITALLNVPRKRPAWKNLVNWLLRLPRQTPNPQDSPGSWRSMDTLQEP